MQTTLIHLSDLHFRNDWDEDLSLLLDGFFGDLRNQIKSLEKSNVFVIFSGDFVLRGGEKKLYDDFFRRFDKEFNILGISKNQRICVPGNHDVSQDIIKSDLINHDAVISSKLNEKNFNDYIHNPSKNILNKKFENYKNFEKKYAAIGVTSKLMSGGGFVIKENLGVYCLNSAICSSGGVVKDGNAINDYQKLAIDTRNLSKWISECKAKVKILVMHHPIEWLTEWAQVELKNILHKNFSLCLSGHNHDQDILHSIHNDSNLVQCSAPPLLTHKYDDLGYSMIEVDTDLGIINIKYRQWTKRHSFVAGVNFSDTDNGIVTVQKATNSISGEASKQNGSVHEDYLSRHLNKKLEDALHSFPTQPIVWVEPVLKSTPDSDSSSSGSDVKEKISISDFIKAPRSTFIKSRPQFGLTCLARYFCKQAWEDNRAVWLYFDSTTLDINHIENSFQDELTLLGYEQKDVQCIVLDSWSNKEKLSIALLQKLSSRYEKTPIVVMETIESDSSFFVADSDFKRDFETLYLWPLSRGGVRTLISSYNAERYIGDIDSVIAKVVSDLEVLNLPRTPLNCLTILKVSEFDFDESPVNRAELINRILFILFNMDSVPTYKTRPDLKDCEYVLGYFCEIMIRENAYVFTRKKFLETIGSFCKEKVIELDAEIVFEILRLNNILIERQGSFCFRFAFWIFYFTAQRMHHDKGFSDFVLGDMRYASFPEIIEFYTGIDRRREDALNIIINDLEASINTLENKLGFPKELDIFNLIRWTPSKEDLEKIQHEFLDSVNESRLPDFIKDKYADRNYDQIRPYNQEIEIILKEYSMVVLLSITTAGARAIRNSDYANPEIKRKLLDTIMQSLVQMSKTLIALAPILAKEGWARYEGANIRLYGFSDDATLEEKFNDILASIPPSIMIRFQDDLFSRKLGPLLEDRFINESSDLVKHYLVLLLIVQKPRGWKHLVENYISSVSKNSYYLWGVYKALSSQYLYSFVSYKTLEDIKYLMKMIHVKHTYGVKQPGIKAISKISDQQLPRREDT